MPGIIRKTAQIFAGNLSPASNIAEFATLAEGAVEYSNDPAAIQTEAWANGGLQAALIGNKSPSIQDLNGILYTLSYQLAYLLARGIPEWDSGTNYNQYDICRVGNTLYSSLTNANIGNAPPSASWQNFFSGIVSPNLALAWCVFDGRPSSPNVLNGYNVSGVSKLGAGSYIVEFENALPSINYAFSGSAGVQNGQTADAGSNNVIIGAPNGAIGIRNTTECQVCCRETTQSPGLEDNGCISVIFFGS